MSRRIDTAAELLQLWAQQTCFSCAGKAKKKIERAQRKSLKKAIASGEVDLDMADASEQNEKAE